MKITRPIRAVLFDMDGVMVDSEFVYMKYLLEFAREKNPAVTMEDINPMVGRSRQDSWMVMEEVGMRPEFDLIVSGKQFKQSKPNPEIYHYTADTLGIREDECFVVEDSTVGIEAAYRAGMSIAGLKDDRFGFDQSKADYHIDSISDILKYL